MSNNESTQTIKRNRAFISTAMGTPLLSQDEEYSLAMKWRHDGDEKALHRLVTAYVRLVVATASKFRNYGLPMGDLVQEGNVGLMQAAARFEPERQVRFSTYASWWIRSAMQEYILRNWSIVRTGTSATQKSLFFNLRWLRAKIEDKGETALTEETRRTIAEKLHVKQEDVEAMALRLARRDQSLNAPIGEDGADQWEDFLVDDSATPEDVVLRRKEFEVKGDWLMQALRELSDREQLIIRERRLRDERTTLEQLGQRLGITKERVRQIEHKAFEKLRSNVLRLSREGGSMALMSHSH